MPGHVEPVRSDESMGEQVQAQVGVGDVLRRRVEVDLGAHDLEPHAAAVVLAGQRRELVRRGRGVRGAEVRVGVPGVENGAGLVNRSPGRNPTPCAVGERPRRRTA